MFRLLAAFALALPACVTGSDAPPAPLPTVTASADDAPADGRMAVVELFTSEGCSSCPPADDLLHRLAERPDVVALSFHVDYWDGLGWRDPFGSAAFTARQRAYARVMTEGRPGVYTPQMIVGGTVGFVGSRPGEARSQIAAALGHDADAAVSVAATRGAGDTIEASFEATDAPAGAVVHVALVQREAVSDVARGENRGRALRHANVVRAFETATTPSGRVRLALPAGVGAEEAFVVAYVQRGATGAIAAAARADING